MINEMVYIGMQYAPLLLCS